MEFIITIVNAGNTLYKATLPVIGDSSSGKYATVSPAKDNPVLPFGKLYVNPDELRKAVKNSGKSPAKEEKPAPKHIDLNAVVLGEEKSAKPAKAAKK